MIMFELAYGGVERQAEMLAQAAVHDGYAVDLVVLGPTGPAESRFRALCDSKQILNANLHHDRLLHDQLREAAKDKNWSGAIIFSTAKIAVLSHALRDIAPRQAVYVGNPVPEDWMTFGKHQFRAWRFPPSDHLVFQACSRHVLNSLLKNPFFRKYQCQVSWNCVPIPEEAAALREVCRPFHFGMVARLEQIKDQATLIRTVAVMREQGQDVRLHLVGEGDEEARLRQLARDLAVSEWVHFEGTTHDVFAAMSAWDVFAFSTTKEEGFGAAAAEAMALGLPCVFTDTGPCREVGGETVLYAPPDAPRLWARTLTELVDNPSQRRQLGQAARLRAAQLFTKERMWRDYQDALGLLPRTSPP